MGNCCGGQVRTGDAQSVPGGKPLLRNKTQRLNNWRVTGVVALRDANLKEIPEQVSQVGAAARTLDASNNKLAELPDRLPEQLPNLQRLVLAQNLLASLPPTIGQLTSLKVLLLDGNRLADLPGEVGRLAGLEKLSASSNCLSVLPSSLGGLTRLKELVVKDNKLRELPEQLATCTSLEVIDAQDNYLQEIPASLGQLPVLQSLQLDGNKIQSVPPQLLLGCSRLQTLSLHRNPITAEQLQGTEGYQEFNSRRVGKFDKKIGAGLEVGPNGLDEGVDRKVR